jgi:hypothetical protein
VAAGGILEDPSNDKEGILEVHWYIPGAIYQALCNQKQLSGVYITV